MGCFGGCLVKCFLIASLSVALVVGWFWGPTVVSSIDGFLSDHRSMTQGSQELAANAMEKLDRFREGGSGDILSLSVDEVTSLLLHFGHASLPKGTLGLYIEMKEGKVKATSHVSTSNVPQLLNRESIPDFLPDTVSISVEGSIIPLSDEVIGLALYGAQVSFIPLPESTIPQVLQFFGVEMEDGYPGAVARVSLPAGISGAYILHDRLFLSR